MTATLCATLAAEDASTCHILAPGTFHGNEVTAQAGEIWLGLFTEEERCELLQVELQIIPAEDHVMDRNGEQTARKVYNCGSVPLLYLFSGDADVFHTGEIFPLLLQREDVERGDVFELTAEESLEVREEGLYYLKNGQEQRICNSYENLYGEGLSITWAGDLDGDGLTDLIVDDRGHYAIPMGLTVFLSSFAEEDELVHFVAEFVTVSC